MSRTKPITNIGAAPSASLWTVHEVSAYLRVPVETLYRWRKLRTGPPAGRVGKHLRYDPADVRDWFRQQAA